MHFPLTTFALTSLVTLALGDALSDLHNLQRIVATISNQVALSIQVPVIISTNGTTPRFSLPVAVPYNTSTAIESISAALLASGANYNNNKTAFVSGSSPSVTDSAYMSYVNEVPTLAQALVARGRAWHSEENRPVYNSMQNISQMIYAYGNNLTRRNLISTGSTIRSITASGNMVDAMDAWNMPGWLPGA